MGPFSKVATISPAGHGLVLRTFILTNRAGYLPAPRLNSSQSTAVRQAAIRPELDGITNNQAQAFRQKYPLSILTTRDLLRSLLISTVSSHSFLLTPALHTLSFLCKPFGGRLLDVDRNPVLRKILKPTFYDQFCAGENPVETKQCAQKLKDLGFEAIILTYGKESLHGDDASAAKSDGGLDPEIDRWKVGIMETIDSVSSGDYIAFKLTGAGRAVTSALAADEPLPSQMVEVLDELCVECKNRNMSMIVDAESQDYQVSIDKVTLELMRKYNQDGTAVVYNTYQAYLKKTPKNVVDHLVEANKGGFTLGLKVVRGAYILSEERSFIHDTKEDTDRSYNSIAQGALKRQLGNAGSPGPDSVPFPSVKLLLCGHNKESLSDALSLHQDRLKNGLPTVPVAFAQLHGMSDALSFSLLQQDTKGLPRPTVIKCSTWGTLGECLAYLVRRAVENKSAVMRTTDEHRALKQECWRRLRTAITG
ncbi:proline dehydrogenase [Diaporthe helianthi]|uniref:Proline dehydrogenase n=1 Tax=Diaporthe helianthi TaxID=158607 RepID=A0A2P5HVH5_DIAHE|nr:proline dehydrogenase [Diaporthe helianthi]